MVVAATVFMIAMEGCGDSLPKAAKTDAACAKMRTKASIFKIVMHYMPALKSAYNARLKEKRDLAGKITVHFAVNEFGKVIYCKIQESTVNDSVLEASISSLIFQWKFDTIQKPGDISVVTYPFVFSQ